MTKVDIQKIVGMRQENNRRIIEQITKIVDTYPDLRFCQILSILGLDTDRFHEEPNVTLNRIGDTVKKLT